MDDLPPTYSAMSISAQLASDKVPHVPSSTVAHVVGQQAPEVKKQDELQITPKKEESLQNSDKDYKARILQAAMEYDVGSKLFCATPCLINRPSG